MSGFLAQRLERPFERTALLAYLLCVTSLLQGCSAWLQTTSLVRNPPPGLSASAAIGTIPFYPQEDYHCGPAALAMVMTWAGVSRTPEQATPFVYSPGKKGSLQADLVSAARRHGLVAYVIEPKLENLVWELAAEHPVIVLQNLGLSWIPVWHYSVALGFDLKNGVIALHSGLDENVKLPLRTFEHTWKRSGYWGLLVLPPTRLPSTVDRTKYLEAVVGLELAMNYKAAATAYQTALARWPNDHVALIGLANSLHAQGELDSAKSIYLTALEDNPNSAILLNNYAHLLVELGEIEQALVYATRAAAIDGPFKGSCERTLAKISALLDDLGRL